MGLSHPWGGWLSLVMGRENMDGRPPSSGSRILFLCEDLASAPGRVSQLSLAGWDVVRVDDQIEALSAVRSQAVDVGLLYLPVDDMVGMDLPNVLRQVATAAYLPVMILTDSPREQQRCRFLDCGADDVISEKTSSAEMLARIRALLRTKELQDQLSDSRAALTETLARERKLMAKLRKDNAHLQSLCTTDPLTHLENVRSFHDLLQHEFRMAVRYEQPISVLMLDVDHFKVVNDEYGHPSGDYVLKEVAVIMKQSVRESDVVARTGGEEFSVILPKADTQDAARFAERIREEVYARKFTVYGQDIHVTISIGVATFPADAEITSPQMLVYFADQALLTAKDTGRDRVVAVRDLPREVRQRLRRQHVQMEAMQTERDRQDLSGVLDTTE